MNRAAKQRFIGDDSKASRSKCAADGLLVPCVLMDDCRCGERLILIYEVDLVRTAPRNDEVFGPRARLEQRAHMHKNAPQGLPLSHSQGGKDRTTLGRPEDVNKVLAAWRELDAALSKIDEVVHNGRSLLGLRITNRPPTTCSLGSRRCWGAVSSVFCCRRLDRLGQKLGVHGIRSS